MNWQPIDNDHIEVKFVGHFDEFHAQAERELFKSGLFAIKRKYDKKKKETTTIYKRANSAAR